MKPGHHASLSEPQHRKIAPGTLRSLIRASGMSVAEFLEILVAKIIQLRRTTSGRATATLRFTIRGPRYRRRPAIAAITTELMARDCASSSWLAEALYSAPAAEAWLTRSICVNACEILSIPRVCS